MKGLLFITGPILVLLHFVVVAGSMFARYGAFDFHMVKAYFNSSKNAPHYDPLIHLYKTITRWQIVLALSVIGLTSVMLSALATGIYNRHDGCTDPMVPDPSMCVYD